MGMSVIDKIRAHTFVLGINEDMYNRIVSKHSKQLESSIKY